MKVLVTGSTGFIGRYVVNELLKYKCEVIATGRREKVNNPIVWSDKVKYIPLNLNTKIDFYNYFEKPDAVIHLAWEGLPNFKKLFHLENNLFNNYLFLKNFIESGLKNLTVVGTCLEYGMINGVLEETMCPNPQIPYSIAKDSLRRMLEYLNNYYPYNLKWLRLFYLYGEGQSENSILSQLEKAINSNEKEFNMSYGEQLRDYLPVQRAAEIIVKTAMQNKINGIINCCSGKPISIRKLVENYITENNLKIKLNLGYFPYNDFEPFSFWGNNDKLNLIMNGNI